MRYTSSPESIWQRVLERLAPKKAKPAALVRLLSTLSLCGGHSASRVVHCQVECVYEHSARAQHIPRDWGGRFASKLDAARAADAEVRAPAEVPKGTGTPNDVGADTT